MLTEQQDTPIRRGSYAEYAKEFPEQREEWMAAEFALRCLKEDRASGFGLYGRMHPLQYAATLLAAERGYKAAGGCPQCHEIDCGYDVEQDICPTREQFEADR